MDSPTSVLLSMGFSEDGIARALARTNNNVEAAMEILLAGGCEDTVTAAPDQVTDTVIPLSISQYTFADAGSSACTVIAYSVLSMILENIQKGEAQSSYCTVDKISVSMMDGVNSYGQIIQPHSAQEHLAVDDLTPIFSKNVPLINTGCPIQGLLTNPNAFQDLFAQARTSAAPTSSIGIVITKPPETVCVVLPPVQSTAASSESENVAPRYVFFDSHSRPQLGFEGSYLVLCDTEEGIIQRLRSVFTALPVDPFGQGSEDMMSMMYNMFEGSIFQWKP